MYEDVGYWQHSKCRFLLTEKVCGTEAHKIQGSTTVWSVKTDHCGDLQLHEHVPLPLQLYTANLETGQKHVNIPCGWQVQGHITSKLYGPLRAFYRHRKVEM